nr:FAD-dependent oxidoreductase [Auraticoccus cholistanensis]
MAASARVVVVGGGLAATALVGSLREGGFAGPVTVVEQGGPPHDRPPLTKSYLAGELAPEGLLLRPPQWWGEHDVDLRTASRVGTVARQPDGTFLVEVGADALTADRVVLATGGEPLLPPVPGVEHALTLRDRADADRLRDRLQRDHRLVVVGAGLVGSEVAATATRLGCRVTVVDPVVPLVDVLGTELAVWLHLLHREHGVSLVAERAGLIEPGRVHVPGAVLEADTVLVATGMRPVLPVTAVADAGAGSAALELGLDGTVTVDRYGRTSVPGLLAVGDCSSRGSGGRSAGHWESARLDGESVAAGLLGRTPPERGPSWFWTDRYGHHVEALGTLAAAEHVVTRGTLGQPPFSLFGLAGGTVVAAAGVDDPRAVKVARRLAVSGRPVAAEALADPGQDLRRLLR